MSDIINLLKMHSTINSVSSPFFIKNAFAFYVIACKIYNTPVLSRLLQHNVTETDRSIVNKENELLSLQAGKVRGLVCFG